MEEETSILEHFCRSNGIAIPDTINDEIIAVDVGDIQEIWICHVDGGEIEVFARIEGLDSNDPGTLRMLLEANYMGMATDEARLAVDPMDGKVVIAERWPYQRLLVDSAFDDLARFAKLVAAWRGDGVATIAAKRREAEAGDGLSGGAPQDHEIFRL
jgi:hypothetical protein